MIGTRAQHAGGRGRLVAAVVFGLLTIALVVIAISSRSWHAGIGAVFALLALVLGAVSKPTRLEFQVGTSEKHEVVFSFNKFWGNVAITVDGVPAVRDLRTVSVKLTKTYDVTVGVREVHQVRIEKDRALLLAGARRQPVRAYVDEVLVAEAVA